MEPLLLKKIHFTYEELVKEHENALVKIYSKQGIKKIKEHLKKLQNHEFDYYKSEGKIIYRINNQYKLTAAQTDSFIHLLIKEHGFPESTKYHCERVSWWKAEAIISV